MSEKTNDEKLRILQERLAQIQKKQDTARTAPPKEEVVTIPTPEVEEEPKKEKKPLNLKWVRNLVVIGGVAFGGYYAFNTIEWSSLIPEEKVVEKEEKAVEFKYNLSITGNNIAILTTKNTFTDESSAKAFVNDLKVKGFKCDYFYLPENSNSTEEIYQIFLGPYENNEETNQWAKSLDLEFKVINL